MTTRTPWLRGRLAAAMLTLALPMTLAAQSVPAPAPAPAPVTVQVPLERQITLPATKPREILDFLLRENLPFEFDIRITLRCMGSQCSGVVRPSDVQTPQEQLAQCLADCRASGGGVQCATGCNSRYNR